MTDSGAPDTEEAMGPLPTVLFADDFSDGKATGWMADTTHGDWAVAADGANQVYEQRQIDMKVSRSVAGSVMWTNQVVEARVKFVSFTDPTAEAFVASRYQSANDYYAVFLRANGDVAILKRVGGINSDIATYKINNAIAMGVWYTLRLSVSNSTLIAYLNSDIVARATDSALKSGGLALGTLRAVVAFDDVMVTLPP